MNIPTPIIIPKCVTDTLDYHTQEAEKNPWRIKWRGKYVRGTTGKTSWKTEAAARAALFNLMNYGNTPYWLAKENGHPQERCHWHPETGEFVKAAIKALEHSAEIEFVKIQ